jgi:hypothetical protein
MLVNLLAGSTPRSRRKQNNNNDNDDNNNNHVGDARHDECGAKPAGWNADSMAPLTQQDLGGRHRSGARSFRRRSAFKPRQFRPDHRRAKPGPRADRVSGSFDSPLGTRLCGVPELLNVRCRRCPFLAEQLNLAVGVLLVDTTFTVASFGGPAAIRVR